VYGARPLKRVIQREILDPLAMDLLSGRFHEGSVIVADEKDNKLEFSEKG
jgi:ATP-dependent Clp protease ATP-binding subunit ClpB